MFESLSDRFEGIFRKLQGRGRLGEAEVDEVLREIRVALLEADVNFKVVKNFVGRIKERVRRRRPVAEPDARPSRSSRSSTRSWSPPSAARRSRSPTPPSRPPSCCWPASRARARPPPPASWPAGSSSRAATRCSSAPTSSARPRSSSCGCSASQVGVPVFSEPTDPVAVATAGLEEAQRLGPRRAHRRHRRPAPRSTRSLMDEVRRISRGGRARTTRSSSSTP